MAVDKFRIHFLYLLQKRLSFKACVFGGKQMAFVYLAFFDDGTTFSYLPVLSRDFLFGADMLSSFIKERAAGSNLYIRLSDQSPLAENQMDMIIRLAPYFKDGQLSPFHKFAHGVPADTRTFGGFLSTMRGALFGVVEEAEERLSLLYACGQMALWNCRVQ